MRDQEKKPMDPKVQQAAVSGDVGLLRSIIRNCKESHDYSPLSQRIFGGDKMEVGNVFHLAIFHDNENFIQEGIESLPIEFVHNLLCQESEYQNWNPVHAASYNGNLGILQILLAFLKSNFNITDPALLAQDSDGATPLHVALLNVNDECALEIMSMDMEYFLNLDDRDGDSPLSLAMEFGCNQVASKILNSRLPYSLSGREGFTPLHDIPFASREICTLLLKKHPFQIKETSKSGMTVLHHWAKKNKMWPLNYILESDDIGSDLKKDLISLIYTVDKDGDNPFHFLARYESFDASQILTNVYKKERQRLAMLGSPLDQVPWLISCNDGKTPLDCAIDNYEECELDPSTRVTLHSYIGGEEESIFPLVNKECNKAAELIWEIQQKYGWGDVPSGFKFLQAALLHSEKVALWVVQKLPSITSNFSSEEIKLTLQSVSTTNASNFLKWMLKMNPSALKSAPLVWVEACKRGYFSTSVAFIYNCPYFRELCRQQHSTPLHHIRFEVFNQYKKFMTIPTMKHFKNFPNSRGETPLHLAIKNRDIQFTEVLLTTNGIDPYIQDDGNVTAMDLLAQACNENEEWDKMCKRININPRLPVTYIHSSTINAGAQRTSAGEMRATLSVVAALLGTLTFAAGFTLPGGFNSDTGRAIMPKKAAFIVFLLADTYAMCCSMFVLFCLIWSMVCHHDMSLILIDKSVLILVQALLGTLVAFASGLFTVISHESFLTSILIFIMCAFVAISVSRTMLFKIIDWLFPSAK